MLVASGRKLASGAEFGGGAAQVTLLTLGGVQDYGAVLQFAVEQDLVLPVPAGPG